MAGKTKKRAAAGGKKAGPAAPNPLLGAWTTPFEMPPFDRIEIEHFVPALDRGFTANRKEIAAIAGNAQAPTFAQLWPELSRELERADFLAAHNAPFDRGVLAACCAAAGVVAPRTPFVCTVRLARAAWNVKPTTLPDVCRYLGLELKHHEALSDAEACARIVLTAGAQGVAFAPN